ncbi:hypothetical protein [uncultured Psychroserpens sp.]|uniref:hypothetical protein n=1 Tax=uncultured Psychroserpens sp. TaxID=255436 RepID=UPI002609943D|nr:hypothetical protein [uncultured Psychroserpens sp.]
MNRKIILLGLILISFISCKENENAELTELITVVNQLKTDDNNEFLSTLKPSEKGLRLIFKDGESVNKVIAYSKMRWADISKIPQNSMKPLTENAELKILTVSKSELKSGITNGFPKEYLTIANHLQDGTKLYAMQYLNEDGSEQKMRSVFFKTSDNWMIVPLAYKAFE